MKLKVVRNKALVNMALSRAGDRCELEMVGQRCGRAATWVIELNATLTAACATCLARLQPPPKPKGPAPSGSLF